MAGSSKSSSESKDSDDKAEERPEVIEHNENASNHSDHHKHKHHHHHHHHHHDDEENEVGIDVPEIVIEADVSNSSKIEKPTPQGPPPKKADPPTFGLNIEGPNSREIEALKQFEEEIKKLNKGQFGGDIDGLGGKKQASSIGSSFCVLLAFVISN